MPMEYPIPGPNYHSASNPPGFEFPPANSVAYSSTITHALSHEHFVRTDVSDNFSAGRQPFDSRYSPSSVDRREDIRSYHPDFEEQNSCQVNISTYCTQNTASIPLHAPVPIRGHFPGIEQPVAISEHSRASTSCSTTPFHLHYSYADHTPMPGSFPTPSELLAELSDKECIFTDEQLGLDAGPETARKARRRAMAKSVGFIPTDPDTISSHDKKRHYLECLEEYVTYLHQQLNIIGASTIPLERVQSYRGLTSRSIRTMLVHMENTTRKLNAQIKTEEQRFMNLREAVYQKCSESDLMSSWPNA